MARERSQPKPPKPFGDEDFGQEKEDWREPVIAPQDKEPKDPSPVTRQEDWDEVDQASDESMPASDPPARGVTRVGDPKRPADPVARRVAHDLLIPPARRKDATGDP